MFELYDKVIHKLSGKPCFVIDVDQGDEGPVYGIEAEDQADPDWFYWAEAAELDKLCEDEG